MVSSVFFYHDVHQRLNEFFRIATEVPFAALPALICGDLYQLPPVKRYEWIVLFRVVERCHNSELTEVMRQQEAYEFISLLNKSGVGPVDYEVQKLLKS